MTCARAAAVHRFVDGEATPDEAGDVRLHLIRCRACAETLQELTHMELMASMLAGPVELPKLSRAELLPWWLRMLPPALLAVGVGALWYWAWNHWVVM